MTKQTQNQELSAIQAAAIKRKLVEAEIISRAWSDDAFRSQLETDPKAALAAVGLDVPSDFNVIVENEPTDVLHLTVPSKPNVTEELEDAELVAVAGGSPGLIDGKNCRMADQIKHDFNKGGVEGIAGGIMGSISLAYGSIFGASWVWN